MPYVGSDVHASATAMDKTLAKHRFRDAGLPVARDMIVTRFVSPRLLAALRCVATDAIHSL